MFLKKKRILWLGNFFIPVLFVLLNMALICKCTFQLEGLIITGPFCGKYE